MRSLVHDALLQVQDAVDVVDERGGREHDEPFSQLAVLPQQRAARPSQVLPRIGLGAAAFDDRDDSWQERGALAHDLANNVV